MEYVQTEVKFLGLCFTPEPQDTCWQLRRSAHAHTGLLGWRTDKNPIDAQVPPQAVYLLTHALCSCARLTFLYPVVTASAQADNWRVCDNGYCCILRGRKPAWLTHKPNYPLLSTTDPRQAEKLFHAEPFDWQLQQQIVLLSAKDKMPPQLKYENIHEAFISGNYKRLAENGIDGILSPGVDGDFAGLVVFGKSLWDDLVSNLEMACTANGYEWLMINETEFRQAC